MRARRTRARAVVAAFALSAATALPSAGQTSLGLAEAPSYGGWAAAVDQARDTIRAQMRSQGIPGATAAVAVDGRIVWAEGFGWADVENKVGADVQTRFRIASISKAVTAAAVGQLVEQGRLDLDAPVQRYVPGFPEKPRGTVTTRLLAGHLAGIRHYRGMEFANRAHYDDVVDALEIFAADPLEAPPGERYSYSTYGWNLISAVVQNASGTRFLTYMREHVLDPVGMRETVAEHGDSLIANRGRQYVRGDDGRLLNAPWVDNSSKWAGGGYLSTASDLVRYGSAYLDGSLLRPETVDLMWTPQKNNAGEDIPYGIGWFTGTQDGERLVWHTGGAVGGSTMLLIVPGDRIVVSILTNLENASPAATARAVAGYFAAARP
ncbi:MAG TPA: serine hydrolase domain-containing protein [Longimicrobiales bacterium]|nr:serine hydrolase domain-containing protein [Longimicrobiales bacterium]